MITFLGMLHPPQNNWCFVNFNKGSGLYWKQTWKKRREQRYWGHMGLVFGGCSKVARHSLSCVRRSDQSEWWPPLKLTTKVHMLEYILPFAVSPLTENSKLYRQGLLYLHFRDNASKYEFPNSSLWKK